MIDNPELVKALIEALEKNPELVRAITGEEPRQSLGFSSFIKAAWPYIDGSKYVHNWHIDCIADHLEALFRREIKRLIICIPPRMGKSQICSVCFPSWVWTKDPTQQIYSASYSRELCDRDSWRSRLLILSSWYQSQWGTSFQLATDSNRKNFYHNNKGGYRLALSTQAGSTGHGYDILIIDDPHKATDVNSRAKREAVIHWYTDAISTRANNNNAVQIVIGQRLHYKDLIGFLMDSGDWEVLKLPMEYIPTTYVTKIGWKDPRQYKGELLFPTRFNHDDVAKLKASLRTPSNIAAQLQQEPSPSEGAIIQKNWLKHYDAAPVSFDRCVLSLDFSLGGNINSLEYSYAAGVVVGERSGTFFILSVDRIQDNFTKQIEMAKNLYSANRYRLSHVVIEQEAAGRAVEVVLKDFIDIPIIMFHPQTLKDKVSRLEMCLDMFQEGRVRLPNQAFIYQPWYDEFLDELLKFPKASHDDQVDALVQALLWFRLNPSIGNSKYYNYKDPYKPAIEQRYEDKRKKLETNIGFSRMSIAEIKTLF